MTDSRRTKEARAGRPLAEPGRERPGADVGGIAANADGGLRDARQRRTERRDDDPTGATIGSAGAGARPSGHASDTTPSRPAAGASGAAAAQRGDRPSGTVAHDPDEPPDEGPVESLGRAVSEVVTGPVQDRDEHDPDTPPRGR